MVGAINPPTSGARTLDAYREAAKSVALTGVPTGAVGSGGSNSSSSSGSGSGSGSGGASGTGSGSSGNSGTNLGNLIPGNTTNNGAVPSTTPAPGAAGELRVWKGWAVVIGGIVGLMVV